MTLHHAVESFCRCRYRVVQAATNVDITLSTVLRKSGRSRNVGRSLDNILLMLDAAVKSRYSCGARRTAALGLLKVKGGGRVSVAPHYLATAAYRHVRHGRVAAISQSKVVWTSFVPRGEMQGRREFGMRVEDVAVNADSREKDDVQDSGQTQLAQRRYARTVQHWQRAARIGDFFFVNRKRSMANTDCNTARGANVIFSSQFSANTVPD